VVGAEIQNTASARQGGDYLARAAHYRRQRGLDDFTFPAMFANRIRAYRQAWGATEEDLGRVAVKAYENANRNPLAHMRTAKLPLEVAATTSPANPTFLGNEELAPWLKMSDCSQVSDGGAALILVSEDGLRRLGRTTADTIEVLAVGHATGDLYTDDDPLAMATTSAAARRAYAEAGLSAGQVDVAEVHDCFTIAEVLMYEALGFADRGRGMELVREGRTTLSGDLPVNTGGGLVGFGHPVGATGVKQVLELWRQMKGKCGDYQMSRFPSIGLTANMGGDDKTSVVGLFANA
jgi:acetyl-CoA acyltransferase